MHAVFIHFKDGVRSVTGHNDLVDTKDAAQAAKDDPSVSAFVMANGVTAIPPRPDEGLCVLFGQAGDVSTRGTEIVTRTGDIFTLTRNYMLLDPETGMPTRRVNIRGNVFDLNCANGSCSP